MTTTRILVGVVTALLVACTPADRGPSSLEEMTQWDACPEPWRIVPPDAAGCAALDTSMLYSADNEATLSYVIALDMDDPALDGCFVVSDRTNWVVRTCDNDLADEAQEMWGGELIEL